MIKIKTLDENAPGHLQRLDDFQHFRARLNDIKANPEKSVSDLDIFKDMARFMLPYVAEPEDKDEAFKEIMNASKAEFEQMWLEFSVALSGGAVPPTNGGSS